MEQKPVPPGRAEASVLENRGQGGEGAADFSL